MDPYLEDPAFWEDFHDSFIIYCRDAINDILPDNYEARIQERLTLLEDPDEEPRVRVSDVSVGQSHPLPSRVPTATQPALSVEPVRVELQLLDEARSVYIEIRRRPERDLIAVLELLSPSNKSHPDRREYLLKRNALLRQPIHLIELDLLLGGARLPMRQALPRGDYYAFVSCAGDRSHSEVYAWALDQPLPTVRFPLKEPDADLALNLQPVLTTTYDRGRYLKALRYRKSPPFAMTEQVLRWVDEVLRSLRTPPAASDSRSPGEGSPSPP
jgi:hypothetical protein